jgi:precorrin-6B methylase 2
MLTLKFSELQLQPGHLFLDAGAGFGRHAFEAARLGAKVVALDYASDEVVATRNTFAAMAEAGEISVIHDGTVRRAWLSLQVIFLVIAIVMALPAGRRKREISERELA